MTLTEADLIARYRAYEKPSSRWLVGGEFERAFLHADGQAVSYLEPQGVRWFLQRFMETEGWKPKYEGEYLIELKGKPWSPSPAAPCLTLEPGSQVELSGGAYARLDDLAAEVFANRATLHRLLEDTDQTVTGVGLTPYARIADIPFVPKGRYAVMQRYLPAQGPRAHWMMKGTCAVQASFDYQSEADCADKFHLITDLAPLTVAMFANSPIAEGVPTGWQSTRAWIWTQTDAARTGFPENVARGYTHAGWVEYLLDRPMMFYMREGNWQPAEGRTFRSWMNEGIEGLFPTMDDWELHQTSVFPEARVKSTIEVRSADEVNAEMGVAFCAYWKGILYSPSALKSARSLMNHLLQNSGTAMERQMEAARNGLGARFGDISALDLAREMVRIAKAGLQEQGENVRLLESLEVQVSKGVSPAAELLAAWEKDPSPANILPRIAW